MKPKKFIVRKYVMAHSASEALRKEKMIKPDDVWLDEKQPEEQKDQIGFIYDNQGAYYSEYMKKKAKKNVRSKN